MLDAALKLRLISLCRYDLKTGCLIFKLRQHDDGYGQLKVRGKSIRPHRLMLAFKLGRELRDDELALHKCNNKMCVSVAKNHVYVGSHRQNMLDASRSGLMKGYVRSPTRRDWGTGRAREL